MIAEAEKNKKEDEAFQARIQARNEFEAFVFTVQNAAYDLQGLSDFDRTTIGEATRGMLEWIETDSETATRATYLAKKKELEQVYNPIIAKFYSTRK